MVSCEQGGRCIHKSLLCKNLNPCGNNLDCYNSSHTSGTKEEEEGGLGFGLVMIILVVIVVVLFVIIQVFLILRNEHKLCGYSKRREEGEITGSFVSISTFRLTSLNIGKKSRLGNS